LIRINKKRAKTKPKLSIRQKNKLNKVETTYKTQEKIRKLGQDIKDSGHKRIE
jgi:hypothetical protein